MSASGAPAASHDERVSAWLLALSKADTPLSKSALLGRSARSGDSQRLSQLLASGEVVNLAKGPVMALALRDDVQGRFAPLALACKAVLDHLGLGIQPLHLGAAALRRVRVAPFARAHLRAAVADLVARGQLVPIKWGRHSLVLGSAGLAFFWSQRSGSGVAMPPPPAATAEVRGGSLSAAAVRVAYATALPAGGSMVTLGALQRALGCSTDALHATLAQMLQAEDVFLVQGEPTVLSDADRAAGMLLNGTHYHCVELCSG